MYPLAEKIQERGIGCAVAPMTSVSKYIHQQKRYRDTTGNNVNHPSDFLARTYAQVIYQTVFGYENYEEAPKDLGEEPVVNVGYNAEIDMGGETFLFDGKSGTKDKNFAACVRIEATDGGFFMYHVSDGAKEYINVKNLNINYSGTETTLEVIEYSDTATTVWKYNSSLKAMVAAQSEIAVKLVTPEICLHPLISDAGNHYREECVRCNIKSESEAHTTVERTVNNQDGSITHMEVCTLCAQILKSETTPAPEKPKESVPSVGIYEKFDLDSYITPIWDGKVVHNETVLFVGPDDTPALLYTPDRIISVRSYDLSVEYIEGVDFEIVDGKIIRLEGSRIPYMPLETYYSVLNDKPYLSTMLNGVVTQTIYGEGDTMCKWQIAITYKHSDTWGGPKLESYTDRYADLISKLENGEDVTFHFYGDSITTGANSSEAIGKAPYAPSWARMFTMYVAKQYGYTVKFVDSYSDANLTEGKPAGGGAHKDIVYGTNGTITYVNTAVGGWNTQQGRDNFDAYVKAYVEKYGCDLFVLAFGMNNGGSTAEQVCGYLDEIVVKMEACAPDADVLLVSTMLPNPEAVRNPNDKFFCNGTQPTFEEKMIPLAETINNRGTNCALAPMTSMTRYLYTIKRFRDTTGNNVNHPSDFVVRLYAQTIFQTVFGFENYEEERVALENKPVENANFNAEMTVSGNTVYLDGASGTKDKNYAVCVRFEVTAGGFNMYYVKNCAKVYINAQNGSVVYSDTAVSVWKYDESTALVTSGGVSLKLSAPDICLHPVVSGEETHVREACVRCGVAAFSETHEMVDREIQNADGSTTYSVECKGCGVKRQSYTVPAGVNVYVSASVLSNNANAANLINYAEVLNDEDGTYCRIYGGAAHATQNYNQFGIYANSSASTVTGQYLVIKYRVGENELGQKKVTIYVGTENVGPSSEAERIDLYVGDGSTIEDDVWHTAIINMDTAAGIGKTNDLFKAGDDGLYRAKFVSVRPFFTGKAGGDENDYMDIAFSAICDSLEEAEKLCEDGSYDYYTTSAYPQTVTITE